LWLRDDNSQWHYAPCQQRATRGKHG
jgi:hypothetical protein